MDKDELIAAIAQDYYFSRLSLKELAEKYNVSRYLLNKYLDEAIDRGLVTIIINSPIERNFELETKFKNKFGVSKVNILKMPENPGDRESMLTKLAAHQVQYYIDRSKVIGLTWGDTVYQVIDQFQPRDNSELTFTQFVGENMKYNSSAGSMRMVQKIAEKYGAKFSTIPGPLYVVNNKLRLGLMQEPALKPTFANAYQMDMILSGLGTPSSIDSIETWHNNKARIFPDVDFSQVVGYAYGRPYDINGHFLNQKDDKVFGISVADILKVPERIAIVQSRFKTAALIGALRGHIFSHYITDESIASRAIEEIY